MQPRLIVSLVVTLTIILACNKNTNQLPPVAIPETTTVACFINGLETVDVILQQSKKTQNGGLEVWLKNVSSNNLSNIKVIVEVCKNRKESYDSCGLQYIVTASSLKANDTGGYQLIFQNNTISLKNDLITVGILYYDSVKHPLSGYYTNNIARFEKSSDTQNADIRGYILAEGSAVFRLKKYNNDTAYTIKGIFKDSALVYDAHYYKAGIETSPLILDSLKINNVNKMQYAFENNILSFRVREYNNKLIDSTNNLKTIFVKTNRHD